MSDFLQILSHIWDRMMANATNISTESWMVMLLMFVSWLIFAVLVIRVHIKHPEKYKDADRFIPPF